MCDNYVEKDGFKLTWKGNVYQEYLKEVSSLLLDEVLKHKEAILRKAQRNFVNTLLYGEAYDKCN